MPVDIYLTGLLSREVDLLIDLSFEEEFPLKYLCAMSRAKLKTGPALNYKREYCDITIDTGEDRNIDHLIGQLKHYMTQINKNNYVA